jgi:hypothetical protein
MNQQELALTLIENTSDERKLPLAEQKNIGKHAFAVTFSNTQTTTTSRYTSSNLVLKPIRLVIDFNLSRRF